MARLKGSTHKIDISGQRFGSWTVLKRFPKAHWKCKCDCGVVKILQGNSLKIGTSRRCQNCFAKSHTKHGKDGTRIYNTWAQIKQRCLNKKSSMYLNYGGRGIELCKRWMEFVNFYADMGDIPDGKTLGRIDNDGPYSPKNCRWEFPKEQTRNRRNTAYTIFRGQKVSVAKLAEKYGMKNRLVKVRLKAGWPIEKALNTPSQKSQEY